LRYTYRSAQACLSASVLDSKRASSMVGFMNIKCYRCTSNTAVASNNILYVVVYRINDVLFSPTCKRLLFTAGYYYLHRRQIFAYRKICCCYILFVSYVIGLNRAMRANLVCE